jgi:hypothetical protein
MEHDGAGIQEFGMEWNGTEGMRMRTRNNSMELE